jgi:non-ribosomal peptide synthetase component F
MYMGMRNRRALESMFGYFSNLAALRFRCDPKLPFVKWLSLARGIFLDAEANSALPLEVLRRELEPCGIAFPEISVIFHVWGHRRVIDFANIKMIAERRQSDRMPWGFTIVLDDQAEDDNCQARFDPRIYDPAGVRAFIDRYVEFLNAIASRPEKSLEELLVAEQAEVWISNKRIT